MQYFQNFNNSIMNIAFAILFLRLLLGLLFFFQAYDKLFVLKPKKVADALIPHYTKKGISPAFIYFSVFASSLLEFFASFFLVMGLFTDYVYPVLGFHLILVAFAFGIANPVWDNKYFNMRFICLIALMVLSNAFDKYSLDAYLAG